MSYFGEALTELLERKKMTAALLSELSGVDQASISRYRKGERTWVSPEDLASIAKVASEDPQDRAALIKAHLRDECHGPGADLIEIGIRGVAELRDTPGNVAPVRLRKDAEENFAAIRQWYVKNRNVREVVDGLGNLLRTGDCRLE